MKPIRSLLCLLLALLVPVCAFAQAQVLVVPQTEWFELGEGEKTMTVILVLPDTSTKGYHIQSDCATMMEALLALKLITVNKTGDGYQLMTVDDLALPEDPSQAGWFIAMYDEKTEAFVPMTLPLEEAPLDGQTYAFGIVSVP